jgi:hypothetical protein
VRSAPVPPLLPSPALTRSPLIRSAASQGAALMATAPAPADPKAEAAKMDLLEDDDEFEEFEIDQGAPSLSFAYFC